MSGDVLALIGVAASGITNGLVNGLTLAWPSRPKYVAFLAALLVGIVAAILGAFAYFPPFEPFTRQTWAQVIIVGIGAGLAAAGLGVTQASAQSRRQEATGPQGEPDPVNPQAMVGP